jgi:hypothetical protein
MTPTEAELERARVAARDLAAWLRAARPLAAIAGLGGRLEALQAAADDLAGPARGPECGIFRAPGSRPCPCSGDHHHLCELPSGHDGPHWCGAAAGGDPTLCDTWGPDR